MLCNLDSKYCRIMQLIMCETIRTCEQSCSTDDAVIVRHTAHLCTATSNRMVQGLLFTSIAFHASQCPLSSMTLQYVAMLAHAMCQSNICAQLLRASFSWWYARYWLEAEAHRVCRAGCESIGTWGHGPWACTQDRQWPGSRCATVQHLCIQS